jgi:hypothetical protein
MSGLGIFQISKGNIDIDIVDVCNYCIRWMYGEISHFVKVYYYVSLLVLVLVNSNYNDFECSSLGVLTIAESEEPKLPQGLKNKF